MIKTEISEKEKNVIIIAYASHYIRVFIDSKISTLNPILIIAMILVIRPYG